MEPLKTYKVELISRGKPKTLAPVRPVRRLSVLCRPLLVRADNLAEEGSVAARGLRMGPRSVLDCVDTRVKEVDDRGNVDVEGTRQGTTESEQSDSGVNYHREDEIGGASKPATRRDIVLNS